jgi:hypothetical protein
MIVNYSQGGGSKDTWVLEEDGHGASAETASAGAAWSPPELPGLRQGGEWSGQQQQQQQG